MERCEIEWNKTCIVRLLQKNFYSIQDELTNDLVKVARTNYLATSSEQLMMERYLDLRVWYDTISSSRLDCATIIWA